MMSKSFASILYQISPGLLRSRRFSGLNRAAFGRGFRYRIGIGFVGIVVQNLSSYWMDPFSILCHTAPLKLVFFVLFALPCGAS